MRHPSLYGLLARRSSKCLIGIVVAPKEQCTTGCPRARGYFQIVQQSLGVLQVGGIESFRELIVDLREKIVRFAVAILIAPETGKVRCGAKFERECALTLSRLDRL